MFYRADLIKQTNKALSEDSSIFIVSQSTCDVLRQICKRIINDHGLQEPVWMSEVFSYRPGSAHSVK